MSHCLIVYPMAHPSLATFQSLEIHHPLDNHIERDESNESPSSHGIETWSQTGKPQVHSGVRSAALLRYGFRGKLRCGTMTGLVSVEDAGAIVYSGLQAARAGIFTNLHLADLFRASSPHASTSTSSSHV